MSIHCEGLLSRMQSVLVVDMPAGVSGNELLEVSYAVLKRLEVEDTEAVVINLQKLTVAETTLLQQLNKMFITIQIMGIPVAVTGMQPGLVSAMVHLDVDLSKCRFVKNVHRALRQVQPSG